MDIEGGETFTSKVVIRLFILVAFLTGFLFAQSVWTSRIAGTTKAFTCIAYTGSRFVIMGEAGIVLSSSDAVSWMPQTSGTANNFTSVVWSGSQLLAGDDGSGIRTSPDGITWTYQGLAPNSPQSLAWTGNQFVVVSSVANDIPSGHIATSPDGKTWTVRVVPANGGLFSVAWTGTQLIAVGIGAVIFTSPDGVTWTSRASGTASANSLHSVTWAVSQIVIVGGGGAILTSSDGVTWSARNSGTVTDLNSVTWTGSQLVAVGNSGVILTSPDGITWTARSSGTSSALTSIVWAGNLLVAVGANGTILTSPQGSTSISPMPFSPKILAKRISSSQLFVKLTSSFFGSGSQVVIYSTSGKKMVEASFSAFATEVSLPIGKLSHGVYLLEFRNQKTQITQPFTLAN